MRIYQQYVTRILLHFCLMLCRIVEGNIRFPTAMSPNARDLISKLCTVDVSKRLGNIKGGATTVKNHPWFSTIDWDALYNRRQPGPIIPHLRGPADTRNFEEYEPESQNRPAYTEELRTKYEEYFTSF
jgi:protein kinase A